MFDAIVIGAGPAGAMTAFHAARGGMRILLVDRAPIGRPKACGDALSPNGVATVRAMGVGDPDWHVVDGLRIHTDHRGCGSERFIDHASPGFGATIERRFFDAWLVEQALDAGAEFTVGEVLDLGYEGDRVSSVSLRLGDATIGLNADQVVLATGAAVPRFAKDLLTRTTPARFAAAARGYVDLEEAVGDTLHAMLPIDAGSAALLGYAWAFPVSPSRLNVGVGVLRDAAHRRVALSGLIEPALDRLRRHTNLTVDASAVSEMRSAPLMLGPATGGPTGLLAVGDVAGLTHPISGEGIATALETGALAARAMLAAGGSKPAASASLDDVGGGEAANDRVSIQRGAADAVAQHYWAALHEKKRRLYRGSERIQSIVARPAFAVQRGADIITRNDRFAGRAMRRFMWELPSPARVSSSVTEASTTDALFAAEVERTLVDGIAETAPGAAVLVQELFDSRESEIGWLARFYASACADLGLPTSQGDVLAAALAESSTISSYLAADLSGHSDDPRLHGCNALALLAIDAVTAFVMDRVATADERLARFVLARSRERLEMEAADASQAVSAGPIGSGGVHRLGTLGPDWRLAAGLVALRTDDDSVPAELFAAAESFERPDVALAVGADEEGLRSSCQALSVGKGDRLRSLYRDYRQRRTCGS